MSDLKHSEKKLMTSKEIFVQLPIGRLINGILQWKGLVIISLELFEKINLRLVLIIKFKY